MATRTTKAERRWRRIVEKWRRSGLSARAFAKRHRISAVTMYGWSSRLSRQDAAQDSECAAEAPTFLPVEIIDDVLPAAAAGPTALEVVLPRGEVIRVPPGADLSQLGRVVAALRGALE
ncbi:IS66 family insertion sequence element accessory protein TnpA [Polyangium mundeleinium]|uniref:IS66 family insertion sequence element accessory protein TnpB n=1 Tax=Polyangium mundeleinium TaxID=2995306 RepID=A0ABT5ER50_9BACT|nr:IS66 family insertion sequence element accessory protein TnpB [Polyangium mundeleinium]MDC0743186.1 IS66 family insertion sequence element accessory protein TnpB [Polyangium mundeleinium]